MNNFNIQLFAETPLNSTTTMTPEMKTFYEKRLIDQAEPRLVHHQFADYYTLPKNGGKTIEFRKYDSLPKASTPLSEGVTPDCQALNVTTITSDLHQYGGWTPLTDVLQMTAIDNNVVQATRVLASQAGRTMDSITRDVLAGGTNVLYAPKQNADGTETEVKSRKELDKTCTLTPKLFFRAAAQLGAMNADPIGDSYIAIIHPYAAYDLKTCREFIEAHKYADPETMYRGEIGKLGNIRFGETSEAKIWKDTTCPSRLAVFGTLVLGAHAYGVTELEGGGLEHIVKQLGYGDDPLNQRASVGWKGMRAAERLVDYLKRYAMSRELGTDDPMYQLGMTMIERNRQGDLDYKSVSKLYELEDRFDSEYTEIMDLFRESNVVYKTAVNYYFHKRDENGVWRRIEPSFCRL